MIFKITYLFIKILKSLIKLMSENYNFSDFVKFRKGNTFGIGKIENFSREDDWFEYFEYILSEDLPAGCFIYILIKNIDPI